MAEATEAVIAPQLANLVVPIDSIQLHPDNPRRGVVEKIAESLERFGQTKPVLVQKSTGFLAAGNHTFRAAQSLGWPCIARVEMDWDDATTKAYLVADNRLSDIAENDDAALAEILDDLMISGKLLGTGYTAEDVDDLLAGIDAISTLTPDFEGDYRETPEDTASRYREPGAVVPQRQFVLMYPEGPEAEEVEANVRKLKRDWGVPGMREVVAEALRRVVRFEDAADADAAVDDETAEVAEDNVAENID